MTDKKSNKKNGKIIDILSNQEKILTPKDVLKIAIENEYENVLLIGLRKDGDYDIFANDKFDNAGVNWALDKLKSGLINGRCVRD